MNNRRYASVWWMASGLLACSDAAAPAQRQDVPQFEGWIDRTIGGALLDEVLDVAVTSDRVLVTGYRDALRDGNIEPGGDAIGFVQAYTPTGELAFERDFDTPGADSVEAVAVQAGFIDVVGRTSAAFPGFASAGQRDAFVARLPLDGSGEPTLLQFGDERPQHPIRVSHDEDGALLVGGYDDVYVVNRAVTDVENPIVARVLTNDSELSLDWYRRTSSGVTDMYLGLVATGPAAEVIATGIVTVGIERGPFARRLREDGTIAWTRRFTTIGYDGANAALLGPDGLLYVAGSTFAQLGAATYGQQDVFVLVLDPESGETVRAMQAGSSESEWVRDLAVAPDGSVLVVGTTGGVLPGESASGEDDAFLVRFAADGAWVGSWQAGTPGLDEAGAVAVSEDGTIFVGGFSEGPLADLSVMSTGRDGFVVAISEDELVSP